MIDFDLNGLDIDAAEAAVAEKLEEEASRESIADDGDGCEGGACKI